MNQKGDGQLSQPEVAAWAANEELLLSLKADAWFLESSVEILSNIRREAESWAKEGHPIVRKWQYATTTCIFPECGSGFHEWKVLALLKGRGWPLQHVIFMDKINGEECGKSLPNSTKYILQCC
jgi:hypothetical protein